MPLNKGNVISATFTIRKEFQKTQRPQAIFLCNIAMEIVLDATVFSSFFFCFKKGRI